VVGRFKDIDVHDVGSKNILVADGDVCDSELDFDNCSLEFGSVT